MKTITSYCAFCYRPVWRTVKRVKMRTETCQRELVFRLKEAGTYRYWHSNGSEMTCSLVVVKFQTVNWLRSWLLP